MLKGEQEKRSQPPKKKHSKRTRWEVQHYTVCDGWINTWTICPTIASGGHAKETPITFSTYKKANEELEQFLADVVQAVKDGDMISTYDREEFRIVKV
jgi:hypothetical protein